MPRVTFKGSEEQSFAVDKEAKILAVANRNKVPIRFGCASCRCGTCGVAVSGGELTPMRDDERELLARMKLATDGSVRLACQTRVLSGDVVVDLTFQSSYSPDQGDDEGDEGAL